MEKLLEDLWYSYQLEKAVLTKEERENLIALSKEQDKIFSEFSEDKRKQFEKIQDDTSYLNSIREKNSFLDGVAFGVKFVTEAIMRNDS